MLVLCSGVLLLLTTAATVGEAFSSTSNGYCISCFPPPDSNAPTCTAVLGDLLISTGYSNPGITDGILPDGSACCGVVQGSCATFATAKVPQTVDLWSLTYMYASLHAFSWLIHSQRPQNQRIWCSYSHGINQSGQCAMMADVESP